MHAYWDQDWHCPSLGQTQFIVSTSFQEVCRARRSTHFLVVEGAGSISELPTDKHALSNWPTFHVLASQQSSRLRVPVKSGERDFEPRPARHSLLSSDRSSPAGWGVKHSI